MLSLTYISRAHHRAGELPEKTADEIARGAARANEQLHITGALIYTTAHFAQILEGPAASLTLVMQKIRRDRRHDLVRVLRTRPIATRMFPGWSMAYAGGPVTMDKFISRALLDDDDLGVDAELLSRLIDQFALSRNVQRKLRGTAQVQPPGSVLPQQRTQGSNFRSLRSSPFHG